MVMVIGADTAAAALVQAWRHLLSAVPGGWTEAAGGAVALVTGADGPALNGVWSTGTDPDPGVVAGLLDRVAATGCPHSLQLRPGGSPALGDVAARRGMHRGQEHPLMVLEDAALLSPAQPVNGLTIRALDPGDAGLHAAVAAAGFEAPEETFRQLMTPAVLGLPGVRCYLGETGGQAVSTGLGVTVGDCAGVFNIATVPAYRGRGYGAALTVRAAADGLAAGAAWSWLDASPAAYPLYVRLGYRAAGSFQPWLSVR